MALFTEDIKRYRTSTVREMLTKKLGITAEEASKLTTDELISKLANKGK